MPNMVFFEICVDDLEAAAEFYSAVFGWEISEDEGDPESWNITSSDDDDYGVPGALTARVDDWSSTINTIEVPSLEQCAQEITKAGGEILGPPTQIEGVGSVQYCQDLEGNAFAILESLPYEEGEDGMADEESGEGARGEEPS